MICVTARNTAYFIIIPLFCVVLGIIVEEARIWLLPTAVFAAKWALVIVFVIGYFGTRVLRLMIRK